MLNLGSVLTREHIPTLLRALKRRFLDRKPWIFSFEIADRCPIGCHCYWRAQERVPELSDEQVVAFFKRKRAEGFAFVNLVGGEPYERPRLLEKVTRILPFNWLVTSATTPLRRLANTTHMISVDGADAQTHDAVRRSRGLYERIISGSDGVRASCQQVIGKKLRHRCFSAAVPRAVSPRGHSPRRSACRT
jgi:MoaA/NifB/PqqE/SkfB family radical SAM enzyme